MPASAGIQSPGPSSPGFPLPYQVRDKLRGNDARHKYWQWTYAMDIQEGT